MSSVVSFPRASNSGNSLQSPVSTPQCSGDPVMGDDHLCLLLLLLLPPSQAGTVGVVSPQSLPGWLLLPRSRTSLDWLRNSRPGKFWAVMSLDRDSERGVKYSETVTQTLTTPLSVLHKTWFSKYSSEERLPNFSSINNGHQATPVYYGDLRKTTQSAPEVSTIKPSPSYYVHSVQNKRPSLFHLLFKFIPRKLYFWFKRKINKLFYL